MYWFVACVYVLYMLDYIASEAFRGSERRII